MCVSVAAASTAIECCECESSTYHYAAATAMLYVWDCYGWCYRRDEKEEEGKTIFIWRNSTPSLVVYEFFFFLRVEGKHPPRSFHHISAKTYYKP